MRVAYQKCELHIKSALMFNFTGLLPSKIAFKAPEINILQYRPRTPSLVILCALPYLHVKLQPHPLKDFLSKVKKNPHNYAN